MAAIFNRLLREIAYVETPALYPVLFPRWVWKAPAYDGAVYLTFDDGPAPEITPFVLDQLEKYGARATFFCLGRQAAANPWLAQQMVAQGHALGNHSYNHPNGWTTAAQPYLADIERAQQVLTQITGLEPRLFRPPYGKPNFAALRRLPPGLQTVMWTVLARDWDARFSDEDCLQNVTRNLKPGAVIVLHDNAVCARRLRVILPQILAEGRRRQLRFMPLA